MSEKTPVFHNIMARNVLKEKGLNSIPTYQSSLKQTPSHTNTKPVSTSSNKLTSSNKITTSTSCKRKETFDSLNKTKIPANTHHASSHANLNNFVNTPINRKTFSSNLTGSNSKFDSDRKKNAKHSDSLSMSLFKNSNISTTPSNKILGTPVVPSSNGKISRSIEVNPIWNGVDYSEMIAKKPDYGYKGPGYVVEFDCDPKYLKGLTIEKGLWKISSQKSGASTPFDLGPFLISMRIDEEKKTPAKIAPFNFKSFHLDSAEKSSTLAHLNLDSISAKITDESKKGVPKKSLRWAENLENVVENKNTLLFNCGSSPALAPLTEKDIDEENLKASFRSSRKMRRSYSTSDMNKFLLFGHDNVETSQIEEQASLACDRLIDSGSSLSSTMILSSLSNDNCTANSIQSDEMIHLNLTYDKSGAQSSSNIVNNQGISPSKVINSSFIDSSLILAGSSTANPITNFNLEKMRQIYSIASPQSNIIQTSQLMTSFNSVSDQTCNESAMIKSLQAMKNLMVTRYKLDPSKLSTITPFLVTSEQNYQELSSLVEYIDWLSKHLKNNLVYKNC